MTIFLLVTLGGLFIFLLGALTGNGLITRVRSRRQAAMQRRLHDKWREERDYYSYYDDAEN
jgi:hypothetical protein